MAYNKIIIEKDGSYWIKKKLKGKYYRWGPFNTFQEAENKCVILDNDGWPHKKTKPQYEDFYNPPSINNNEITDISKYNDLILIQISVKLNKSINKSYVKLVYHDYAYSFGFFNDKEEAEQFILKFLINGSIAKQTILSLLQYESVNDFKEDMKIDVSHDKYEDQYIVKRVNNGNVLTLGSYNAENQAENIKISYLNNLDKISCFKTLDKNHFIHFANENISCYKKLKINNLHNLPLTINEIINLMKDFNNFHLTITELSGKYHVSNDVVKKIIFNYESGKFKKVIEELDKKVNQSNDEKSSIKQEEHQIKQVKAQNESKDSVNDRSEFYKNSDKPYKKLEVTPEGKLKGQFTELKFTILQAREIHEAYYEGTKIEDLEKKYKKFSKAMLMRIISNYDQRNFDDYLKKILELNPSNEKTILNIQNNEPFNKLQIDNQGTIYTYSNEHNENKTLGLNLNQINNLYKDYKKNKSIKRISENLNLDYNFIERIINRFIVGDFEKIPSYNQTKNNPIKSDDSNENNLDYTNENRETIKLNEKEKDLNLTENSQSMKKDNINSDKSKETTPSQTNEPNDFNQDLKQKKEINQEKFVNISDLINELNNLKNEIIKLRESIDYFKDDNINSNQIVELKNEISILKSENENFKAFNKNKTEEIKKLKNLKL